MGLGMVQGVGLEDKMCHYPLDNQAKPSKGREEGIRICQKMVDLFVQVQAGSAWSGYRA